MFRYITYNTLLKTLLNTLSRPNILKKKRLYLRGGPYDTSGGRKIFLCDKFFPLTRVINLHYFPLQQSFSQLFNKNS